ncbi:MAG: DUF5658 family protein [Fimbriimonadaceae bacterium]|nr:DUF5658 family protein [Fimbriimonadaceae bacterium]
MSKVLPTRALGLLLMIGFIDLFATAFLHAQGRIIELNPVMRPIIERSEWLFAVVKGGTLLLAWIALATYARHNLPFVRKASLYGSIAYVTLWCGWFFSSL